MNDRTKPADETPHITAADAEQVQPRACDAALHGPAPRKRHALLSWGAAAILSCLLHIAGFAAFLPLPLGRDTAKNVAEAGSPSVLTLDLSPAAEQSAPEPPAADQPAATTPESVASEPPLPPPAQQPAPLPTVEEPDTPPATPAPEPAVPAPPRHAHRESTRSRPPVQATSPLPKSRALPRPVAPASAPAPRREQGRQGAVVGRSISATGAREARAASSRTSPPAAAPTPSRSRVQAGASTAAWRAQLVAHLSRYKRFPAGASAGTVTIAFSIDRTGRVLSTRLVRSSGQGALDAEATSLPRRASPLPAPPAEMGGGAQTLQMPLQFSE